MSYISRADLLINVGAGLEIGWLPLVVRGSRDPLLRPGKNGRLEVADFISLLDQPKIISRAHGDVHPEGNPHFMLGPSYMLKAAEAIAKKLGNIDKANRRIYLDNYERFSEKIKGFIEKSRKKIKKGLKVITYHKTLTYFYRDFGIDNIDVIEPKPGISPSASHIIQLIKKIKKREVKKIFVENYFDDRIAQRIKRDVPSIEVSVIPVAVNGEKGVESILELYQLLVKKMR